MRPHLWLIHFIGVIVPRRLRADWRQEWESELRCREFMLADWDRLDWRNRFDLLRRSTSAFWDALWLQPRRLEDDVFQDVKVGSRMLVKSSGFTLTAVLILALGIGANTAIFSLINALMLRLLPVSAPQELVLFSVAGPRVPAAARYNLNYPLYEMIRAEQHSFAGLIAGAGVFRARLLVRELGSDAPAESVQQQRVSGDFFTVLGVKPALGRLLTEADDDPANTQAGAVISYEFWNRRFGLDPSVVGRPIAVNDKALTIVGVAPRGFFGFDVGTRPELWWPIRAMDDPNLGRESSGWIRAIGRLRPGATMAQAQAEVEVVFRRQIEEVARRSANWTALQRQNHFERALRLEAGGAGYTRLRQQFQQPLTIVMTTVALVLLIACVNLASLMLARATARRKEIAVRFALGAARLRLLRQLLTESVLLAALGGAAGLLFAPLCLRALMAYLPQGSPTSLDVAPDARVLAFTLIVSAATALLFGLLPAWQATRVDPIGAMKDQTGASAGRSRLTLNKSLVVTQVALSLFLLVGAGLFVRSLRNLRTLDAGIDYQNIVQFYLDTGASFDAARRTSLYKQLLTRLEALPGVQSATLLYFSLLGNGSVSYTITAPGAAPRADDNCYLMEVGPRYFETLKMPILVGRAFGPQDERPMGESERPAVMRPGYLAGAPPLDAVINQAMARHFFGVENAVGERFVQQGTGQRYNVIGVTNDAKYANLRDPVPLTYYLYHFQQSRRIPMMLQFRVNGETADYAAAIQRLVREVAPQAQLISVRRMSDVVDESLVQERFIAQTASAFSLFGLLLACVGLYGVMSYTVTQRTNEIGIRMALGAERRHVVRLVMREVGLLMALGIGAGLGVALAVTRLATLFTLLFDLAPTDPATIALATLLLAGVAALAGYLPARRASRVDPLLALRYE
jgi:predicted permease